MDKLFRLCDKFFDLSDGGGKSDIADGDIACFRSACRKFLKSGEKDDAFVVYFCYSEIFRLFGSGYDNTRKLLETLSDHEYHSGGLLAKHRDHYSHSVYVFALGLAVYACDKTFRTAFCGFYGLSSATDFLRLWGAVSLFHDVGYPFQLAHEQIKIYTEELWGDSSRPYVSYGNMREFLSIPREISARISKTLKTKKTFGDINELLAYGLEKRKGYNAEYVCKVLKERVERQPRFMDHGYFGAVILARRLFDNGGLAMSPEWLDVLTAILLHNSLNKYDLENARPVKLGEHPLAYLLILCDELQNWDRLAYGKISKRDPIAWDAEFTVGDDYIAARYIFDSYFVDDYSNGVSEKRHNKSYDDIRSGRFAGDIHKFIDTDLKIIAETEEKKKNKRAKPHASEDSFINLCDFAKAIHAGYGKHCKENSISHIDSDFASLPLEFKVSNIEQAKSYAYKLGLIDCFYSGKDLDYPVVDDFNGANIGRGDNIGFLCREEHVRWVKEKLSAGWRYGTDYKDGAERNAKKIHKDIVPYEVLPEAERSKDELMVRNIIPLLRRLGNDIKIYNCRSGGKPDLVIAGTGHRYIDGDREKLKERVKEILKSYAENYRVTVMTCYAAGADLLIAECAGELNLTTKAVIPMEYEEYIKDAVRDGEANGRPMSEADVMNMRHLLAQTAVCKVVPDPAFTYFAASKYLTDKCDGLIALWDGKELDLSDERGRPINRGGTYHCIAMARERGLKDGKSIHIIGCTRK